MNFSDVALSLRKEFTEALRDKRTLIIMVAFAIVYPLLGLIPAFMAMQVSQQAASRMTTLCLVGDDSQILRPSLRSSSRIKLIEVIPGWTPENMVIAGKCDVVLETAPRFAQRLREQKPAPIKIIDNAFNAYVFDEENIDAALNKFADEERAIRLAPYKLPLSANMQVNFSISSNESVQQRSAYWTGIGCTLLLMLTMILSSMYPALDVITGERERGTLVLLLMAPGQRRNFVIAKLLTVSVITVVAALLSLISACLSMVFMMPEATDFTGSFNLTLPIANLLLSSIFLIPLAVSIAACSILISSYARTFQQGQSYFTPFMIVGIVLTAMTLAFDESAPFFVNFLPLMNLLLCMHKAIQGQWNIPAIVATTFGSFIHMTLLLRVSIGILDREEALFGIKQPPARRSSYTKEVFVLFGSCLAGFFYISGALQVASTLWGTLLAQIICFVLPAIVVPKVLGAPLKQTLSLFRPSSLSLLGAILLAPGMALGANFIAQMQTGIMPNSESYIKELQGMIIPKGGNAWIAYITIAAGPTICEELIFRGTLQGLLRKSFSKPLLCITIGVLFGILHGSSARFLPTTIMGILLSVVTESTGSIFPAMLMHFCNNSLAVYQTLHPLQSDLSPSFVVATVVSSIAAIGVFYVDRKQQRSRSKPNVLCI